MLCWYHHHPILSYRRNCCFSSNDILFILLLVWFLISGGCCSCCALGFSLSSDTNNGSGNSRGGRRPLWRTTTTTTTTTSTTKTVIARTRTTTTTTTTVLSLARRNHRSSNNRSSNSNNHHHNHHHHYCKPKKRYRPLHHPPRQKDPLAVERDLPQRYILGSDESGTGSLAGPVVTATCCCLFWANQPKNDQEEDDPVTTTTTTSSTTTTTTTTKPKKVLLPEAVIVEGVQDGKRLSRAERWRIYQHVQQHPDHYQWTFAMRSAQQVDDAESVTHAIADCFVESMETLVTRLRKTMTMTTTTTQTQTEECKNKNNHHNHVHDFLSIVDGPWSPKLHKPSSDGTTTTTASPPSSSPLSSSSWSLSIPSRPWIGGDNIVYTVALASILAQVTRDQMMDQAAQRYPHYGFDRHKGYGTRAHFQALAQFGPLPTMHRQSSFSCKLFIMRQQQQQQQRQYHKQSQEKHGDDEEDPSFADREIKQSTASNSSSVVTLSPHDWQPTMDRASFLTTTKKTMLCVLAATTAAAPVVTTPLRPARAMYRDSKSGSLLPDPGEIAQAVPSDWTTEENNKDSFFSSWDRLDSSDDALFYQKARFVEHVDDQAVQIMTRYIAQVLEEQPPPPPPQQGTTDDSISVLDLCSSWTSHFPSSSSLPRPLARVAGLGMNAHELQANPSLTEWIVQDLNQNPLLPYHDASFDVILCQLSIDYLTQPWKICREMARVAKPGGTVHVLFSNRVFITKAVAVWTGADDVDHAYTVASYLHYCNNAGGPKQQQPQQQQQPQPQRPDLFTNIVAQDLSVRTKRGRIVGDPMYVVSAVKA